MKVEINNNIVKETNRVWGYDMITNMAMEEFAEVIQAVNKVKRFPKDEKMFEKLNEEVADVLVIIDQLEELGILNENTVQHFVEFKQKRQASRNREMMALKAKQ
ncbi:MAG: hypothetical protein ACI4UK_08725 [Floccifex sp.]